jgi:Zn-dependent protease with chaperone function
MPDQTAARDAGGIATFAVEAYRPFDIARPVAGTLQASATALVLTAAGERLELAPASVTLALGGHNRERVVIEGEVAAGSRRAGERVYLQVPDQAILAHLAAHGLPALRPGAARLLRRGRAVSRRWRTLLAAAAAALLAVPLLLFFTLDSLVKRTVSGIPVAWENTLGASLFASLTAGRTRAPERETAVARAAFERLRAPLSSPGYAFECAVLESPEVNAFALPGGKLVVFTGLLAQAGRPEEVAGVLAHELQHVVLRHGLQKMVRAAGLQAALALLVGDLDGLGVMLRDAGLRIQELSYGREQELEADRTAIDLLAGAGIDPAGLPDFFDRLSAAEAGAAGGGTALALLSTHPASAERGAALRAAIAKRGAARYEPLRVP